MKSLVLLLVLISCQQLFALPSFDSLKSMNAATGEQARTKLDALRKKLNLDVHTPTQRVKLTHEQLMKKYENAGHQMPDFEARKVALTKLTQRINTLRAAQPEGVKPDSLFFEEIKKTLEESRQIKMVDLPVQRASNNDIKVIGAETVAPHQNLENFAQEMLGAHRNVQALHANSLTEIFTSRTRMVNALSGLARNMMQNLGETTEALWSVQRGVMDFIALEEWVGAEQDCVNAQRTVFDDLSRVAEDDLNRCARDARVGTLRNIRGMYYPELDFTIMEISGLQFTVLTYFSRTNLAIDQTDLIEILLNEVEYGNLRGNNRRSIMVWEVNRFVDETRPLFVNGLAQCLSAAQARFETAATEILEVLGQCPLPV